MRKILVIFTGVLAYLSILFLAFFGAFVAGEVIMPSSLLLAGTFLVLWLTVLMWAASELIDHIVSWGVRP